MRGVGLGDHRVAGRDGRGEVAARHAVERERKIVRAEHDHRSERLQAAAKAELGVDHRFLPRALAHGGRGLAKLGRGPRQFDLLQPRRDGQPGLLVGHRHQFGRFGLNPRGVVFQKLCDGLGR